MIHYIKKHFKGKLKFTKAFWANYVLVNVLIFLVTQTIIYHKGTNTILNSKILIFVIVINVLIIKPWQIIGLWRTSNNKFYKKSNSIKFSIRILTVVILFFNMYILNTYKSVYLEVFKIVFIKDKQYSICLVENNRKDTIYIEGEIGYGISNEVEKIVKKEDIKFIIIKSEGGIISEAENLADIILQNGIITFAKDYCMSAATIPFISGEKRYKDKNALILFHKYYFTNKDITSLVRNNVILKDIADKSNINEPLNYFKKAEIKEKYLDKIENAIKTKREWIPTNKQMLEAGIIDNIISLEEFLR